MLFYLLKGHYALRWGRKLGNKTVVRLSGVILFALMFSLPTASVAQTPDQIREAQSLLVRGDRHPGPIDGAWGGRTEAALIDFLASQNQTFDGELSDNELKLLRAAPHGPRYRERPFRANGRPIEHTMSMRGLIQFPGREELPQFLDPPPNDITLSFYFDAWLQQRTQRGRYEVQPAGNSVPLRAEPRNSDYLERQLRDSSMLSYLMWEDGRILYDGLAPSSRFEHGFTIDGETPFRSQSVGKSLVSYVIGHAICEGYIPSLDVRLDDWPLVAGSLFAKRTLHEILDMRARDQHLIHEGDFLHSSRPINGQTIAATLAREYAGAQPNPHEVFNYNDLATNVAFNYAIFRVGDDFQGLLDRIFRDHVRVEDVFSFQQLRFQRDLTTSPNDGIGWYLFYATRHDYLRIALAMLNDWHSDRCIGRYLHEIYDDRQNMRHSYDATDRMTDVAQSYGGQFWFDLKGMRDRPIFGMNGNNGQNVVIDMDRRRIIVLNAAHTNFPWRTLVYDAIRDGRLPE